MPCCHAQSTIMSISILSLCVWEIKYSPNRENGERGNGENVYRHLSVTVTVTVTMITIIAVVLFSLLSSRICHFRC